MPSYPALSVVSPAGNRIRSGEKTLEIRQWQPDQLPLRDLVIIQNQIRLGSAGATEDPDGQAVAIVDVESVADWKENELLQSCASFWEPGWLAWKLTNVRPLDLNEKFPARQRIYTVKLPANLP